MPLCLTFHVTVTCLWGQILSCCKQQLSTWPAKTCQSPTWMGLMGTETKPALPTSLYLHVSVEAIQRLCRETVSSSSHFAPDLQTNQKIQGSILKSHLYDPLDYQNSEISLLEFGSVALLPSVLSVHRHGLKPFPTNQTKQANHQNTGRYTPEYLQNALFFFCSCCFTVISVHLPPLLCFLLCMVFLLYRPATLIYPFLVPEVFLSCLLCRHGSSALPQELLRTLAVHHFLTLFDIRCPPSIFQLI